MNVNMPPEPPSPNSESDYTSAPRRVVNVAPFEPDSHLPFGVDDVPIPGHLAPAPATPELNAAWAAVLAAEHGPIPKRGHNKFFNYDYATADDIRSYVGRELGRNGLHYEQHPAGFTVWGHLIRVTYYFVIRHSSGQSSIPIRHDELVRTTSEKGTPDDKALGKAGVLALKNFTKVHFSIDTGDLMDDPDADGPVVAPVHTHPSTSARTKKRDGGAGNAFRDAGLPKTQDMPEGWRPVKEDEIFAPGRTFRLNQSTGSKEVLEPDFTEEPETEFVAAADAALRAEPNGTKALKLLMTFLEKAPTISDVGQLKGHPFVANALANWQPSAKTLIEEAFRAAGRRLAPDSSEKDDGTGKAEKEFLPGDP